MNPSPAELASAWRTAAAAPAVAARLDALFTLLSDQITLRGPACWASGRCCNFEAHGHRLYVTGLEAAWVIARTPTTLEQIDAAQTRGGCPYQSANLCTIHTAKPFACRAYFCDRSAQQWQQDLMERLMHELRALHDQHAIPYRYLEWRAALRMLTP